MTARRLDGWTVRGRVFATLLLAVYPSSRLYSQDSQFGVLGLGTPGRYESVRARSTGGAFTPFDPLSPLTEAPLADLVVLTATAMEGTSYRQVDLSGSTFRFWQDFREGVTDRCDRGSQQQDALAQVRNTENIAEGFQ